MGLELLADFAHQRGDDRAEPGGIVFSPPIPMVGQDLHDPGSGDPALRIVDLSARPRCLPVIR